MPKYVFGNAVFATAQGRDRVQRQGERSFARAGFVPATWGEYPAGIAATTFTWPPLWPGQGTPGEEGYTPPEQQNPDAPPPGGTSPALTFCYTHPDEAMVDLAQREVLDAMDGNGWIRGFVGTQTSP